MATPTILQSDFVVELILPFLLVFTIVFAILQKTEILGKGKKQIDAIVALVVGLIVIAVANAVGVILSLIPFLAVALVVILVFLLLWGAFYHQGDFKVPEKVRLAMGVIAAIVVVGVVVYVTPAKDFIARAFIGDSSGIVMNIIIIIVVIAAIAAVLFGGGKEKKEEKT